MSSKPTTKPGLMTVAAAGLLVALTACGSSVTTSDTPTPNASSTASETSATTAPATGASAAQAAKSVLITIKDFAYTLPASVAPGAKIMVTNKDDQNHTVTSTPKGAFAVNVVGGGGTASFTAPSKPGSYQIVCDFHANMTATLVVK